MTEPIIPVRIVCCASAEELRRTQGALAKSQADLTAMERARALEREAYGRLAALLDGAYTDRDEARNEAGRLLARVHDLIAERDQLCRELAWQTGRSDPTNPEPETP